MSIVTCDISVSMDGYSAGADQSLEQPLGNIDETWLHAWMFDGAATGRAGGATTRPTTGPCSCSPTAIASPSRWTAAPRSTS